MNNFKLNKQEYLNSKFKNDFQSKLLFPVLFQFPSLIEEAVSASDTPYVDPSNNKQFRDQY